MDQNLHAELVAIHGKLDEIAPLVRQSNSILMGNGKTGLVFQVEKLMRAYSFWRWIAASSFIAVIGGVAMAFSEKIFR